MVEEERQDNFMSATNGPNGGLPPIPDPTLLTTQQLMREFTTLKELIFTRLDGMEETTKLLQTQQLRVPSDTDKAIQHLRELTDTRFDSIEIQFKGRDTQGEVEAAIKALIDKIDGPSGVARTLDRYVSRDTGRSEETTIARSQKNQSMTVAVALGVSLLAVTISIMSLLTPAPRVVYQQPPQIGSPVKPN